MQLENTPIVHIGIMSDNSIKFVFNSDYKLKGSGLLFSGNFIAEYSQNGILFNDNCVSELYFEPVVADASFDLIDVTIGKNFHWQQKENQRFQGDLKIIVENGMLTAINVIDVERYLTSVISSEMKATSSMELLKAHAVISRSWLMAQISKQKINVETSHTINNNQELIKWYDHDDHTNFDVCADDHCQRYQGITRQTTNAVVDAIAATRGQILIAEDNTICDARFSKACGGVSETYESCWDDTPHSYLVKVIDNADESNTCIDDLRDESNATRWILNGDTKSFCNTTSKRILSQVLNNYDQNTADFYRWEQRYTQEELRKLIETKSGYSFGDIVDLQPVERGESGRIIRLKIVGTNRTLTVGKELEIRRWLSSSHLYSSAFIVEKTYGNEGQIPLSFTLKGAGWGHGAGLCQIGAAVMADKGYDYNQILMHYYKNSQLKGNYGKRK